MPSINSRGDNCMTTKVPFSMLSGSGAPAARAVSYSTTVANSDVTATQFASYPTPTINEGGAFNPATGRFTPQVAGLYLVSVEIGFTGGISAANSVAADICKNGATAAMEFPIYIAGSARPHIRALDLVYLNGTTDYVIAGARQNSGASVTGVSARFNAYLVRPV